MSTWAGSVCEWLLATSCQLPVPFAAAWLLDRALPARAWPELRAAAWSLVACKLVLPPTLATEWHAPLASLVATPAALAPSPTLAWLPWLWLLGTLTSLVGLVLAPHRALARAHRDARPPSATERALLRAAARIAGLRRLPRCRFVADGGGSRVLATPRTWLLLDTTQLAGLDGQARTHLLLHELTHVRRADAQRALLLGVLRSLFWFHPLVWLLERRLHALRELCCDQAVVRTLGGDPLGYRATLLAAVRPLLTPSTPAHAFAPWGSLVLQRLRALEQPRRVTAGLRRATITAATLLLAIACVPLAPLPPAFDLDAALRAPGCLNRQFAVLAALAQADAAQSPPSPSGDPR